MEKIKFYFLGFFAITVWSLFFISCSNTDSTQTSRVIVRMVDAPGDYEEVNVEVMDVLIKDNLDPDDVGWVSIGGVTPQVYNLLDLTGGIDVLLADSFVPSGYLGQFRLLLGGNNTVVIDGKAFELKTPSAQQSGLKLKVNQVLLAGATYDFLLDFDVDRSVVKAGNSGNYNLKPVIRVSTTATSGVIKGTVTNLGSFSLIAEVALEGGGAVLAGTNDSSMFQLNGIPAGIYDVTLNPETTSGKASKTILNVVVINGEITNVGDVLLDDLP